MRSIVLAAGLMLGVVVLGAFGAHALAETLNRTGYQHTWETAVLYHAIHGLALLAVGIWQAADVRAAGIRAVRAAGWLWTVGIVAFSGSLYALSVGGPKWLGPVTPFGGLCLISGWAALAFGAWGLERRSSQSE